MPGRKIKPTALKLIEGNPGKRPLNKAEPKPEIAAPTCPKHLTDRARKEWERIVPELLALGMLTRLDRAGLAAYCQVYARWVEAEEMLKLGGPFVLVNGRGVENPHLVQARKALDEMRKFLVEFGMSPASRPRVSATKAPAKNRFADLGPGE